jgi:hypothetical protein
MKITQISIFLENRKGRLYEVFNLLGENEINVLASTIAETENFGILRTVVSHPVKALEILKKAGFAANETHVVVVEVSDKPGELAKMLKLFNDNTLNIEYMHAFIRRNNNKPCMVFRFEEPDLAIEVLQKNGVNVVSESEMTD